MEVLKWTAVTVGDMFLGGQLCQVHNFEVQVKVSS